MLFTDTNTRAEHCGPRHYSISRRWHAGFNVEVKPFMFVERKTELRSNEGEGPTEKRQAMTEKLSPK